MQPVSTLGVGARHSTGIGYVVIPNGQDKEKYISFCYSNGCVSMLLENGGIIDEVLVSQNCFNDIVFPESPRELGSLVVWVNKPYNNQPIIVGVLNKNEDVVNLKKGQASLSKTNKSGFCEVVVDGEKTILMLNSNSLNNDGGDVYIIAKNNSNTAKVNLFVGGNIDINAINFNSIFRDSFNVEVDDKEKDNSSKVNIVPEKVDITSSNINIGGDNAKEPILLGDKTVDMLDKILEILGRTTTATLIGPQPLITGPEFIALRAQLETLKSLKHKIE